MDNNAPATDKPVDYIQHHLQPLAVGDGFWSINIDTMFFSILLAGIVMIIAYRVGKTVLPEYQLECKMFLSHS